MTEIKTFVDLKGVRDLHIFATNTGLQMRSTSDSLLGGRENWSLLLTWEDLVKAKVMMTELSEPEPTELEKAAREWALSVREDDNFSNQSFSDQQKDAYIQGAKWLAERLIAPTGQCETWLSIGAKTKVRELTKTRE
jgi:hypothetical protein